MNSRDAVEAVCERALSQLARQGSHNVTLQLRTELLELQRAHFARHDVEVIFGNGSYLLQVGGKQECGFTGPERRRYVVNILREAIDWADSLADQCGTTPEDVKITAGEPCYWPAGVKEMASARTHGRCASLDPGCGVRQGWLHRGNFYFDGQYVEQTRTI